MPNFDNYGSHLMIFHFQRSGKCKELVAHETPKIYYCTQVGTDGYWNQGGSKTIEFGKYKCEDLLSIWYGSLLCASV